MVMGRSTCQKTSAVSDQTDTSLLRTARDETNNPANNLETCPCLPLLLDLQNKVKLIKANSSWQILPNLTSNNYCELTKLKTETSRRGRPLRLFKA